MPNFETTPAVMEGTQAAFPKRELTFPKHTNIALPNGLYRRFVEAKKSPKKLAFETFKLGVLADRGFVYQKVTGIEPLRLSVSDFDPYPTKSGKTDLVFGVDSSTIRFLSDKSWLLSGDQHGNVFEEDVKDWFLRALNLRQRFLEHGQTRELLMITDKTLIFESSQKGIDALWSLEGLPDLKFPHFWDKTISVPGPFGQKTE